MKNIYIIRHCEAEGQEPEAPLTNNGLTQAADVAAFFEHRKVDRIISSPFKRAIQTIQPLAKEINIEIETNQQLAERVLSSINMPDWFEKLRATFEDFDLAYEGGESSREAANRILGVVDDVLKSDAENTILVTHGGLMSLLLNHYNKNFGFEQWRTLSNPDIYILKLNQHISLERIWRS
ncbi:histidine phosphatase family protein [Fredinandcohnia sp. QZ13]|uniref:histidine phosphatase family protein n=1 Tax=Fredinandcohnia sp. QZ13 TaxID=3073144 RepID=UPI002853522F|nr:histidine phosphatase family protein [Fredinandcohnia sp. QZ13]MDR4889751.1 histidine phosphatase family protein [Fredinandcohnia sp. QZ13]